MNSDLTFSTFNYETNASKLSFFTETNTKYSDEISLSINNIATSIQPVVPEDAENRYTSGIISGTTALTHKLGGGFYYDTAVGRNTVGIGLTGRENYGYPTIFSFKYSTTQNK